MNDFVCEYDYTSCNSTQDEINEEAIEHMRYLYPKLNYELVPITREEFESRRPEFIIQDYVDADNHSIKHHPNVMIYDRLRLIEIVFNPGLNAERWAHFKF